MKSGGKTAKAAKNDEKRQKTLKNGETAKNCKKRRKLFWGPPLSFF